MDRFVLLILIVSFIMESKHLFAVLATGALLASPLVLFAQEAEATPERPNAGAPRATLMKEEGRPLPAKAEAAIQARETRMEQLRECTLPDGTATSGVPCLAMQKDRAEQAKERVVERRSEAVGTMATVLMGRLNAVIERQSTLADRIDSRIVKLKAQGIVTTEAESKIVIARGKIGEAVAAVASAGGQIESSLAAIDDTLNTLSRQDTMKNVRDAMRVAKDALTVSHRTLVDAVVSLKANVKVAPAPETPEIASTTAN
jgi:hypothetical protein